MTTKKEEEDKAFKNADNLIGLLAYAIRYRMTYISGLAILLVVGYSVASNLKYTKKDGLEWIPSISVEVKKELK